MKYPNELRVFISAEIVDVACWHHLDTAHGVLTLSTMLCGTNTFERDIKDLILWEA